MVMRASLMKSATGVGGACRVTGVEAHDSFGAGDKEVVHVV